VNEPPRHPGVDSTGLRTRPRHLLVLPALALSALLVAAVPAAAPPHILRAPRPVSLIRQLLADGPHAGDCEQCHTMHGDNQPTVYGNALVGPDDNSLCFRCHATAWSGGSFAGEQLYLGTGHGTSTSMVWPGPVPEMRIDPDAPTKCLNCHDPHGWSDALGPIPQLALQREEKLCLACHDGSPARTDIASDLRKPFRHPTGDFSARHTGPLESQPSDFGVSPVNKRHAECEDCHNPHISRANTANLAGSVEASKTTLGTSRVAVLNGFAGVRPQYAFVAAADTLTAPNAEYQLCFKCHSSWTTQPVGQTDLALVLNPANPSFHPVEEAGRNPLISNLSFAPGWSATSLTRCGDCHGADFGSTAGPHGSTYEHLLRRQYPVTAGSRSMTQDEACFACHAYDVYANPNSPVSVRAASRFNSPNAGKGHADHVGGERVPCYACHVSHGSTSLPFLLGTGRTPGIRSYSTTATRGTCTPTCHGAESYTVNYAR
jgi:predicted CXXCH cytochrome family protein